jgi:ubiquinone/menaquinone biosynthesis C-methylase UbiE
MRCPNCLSTGLRDDIGEITCTGCNNQYPVNEGILDMIGNRSGEVITPFQRLMQAPVVVSIYEKLWRRLGYYVASFRSFDEEMKTVLRLGKGQRGDSVLDLACGTGVFTRPISREGGGLVVGLDLSWPMLKHARQLVIKEAIQNVLFVRASAFSMPFVDGAFPYVNCCGALHLFDRPDSALREIRRILTPEGRLCVQTTIRPARSAGIAYFLERFIRFGFFGEEELKTLLQNQRFKVVESVRHRISYTFLARPSLDDASQPGSPR